MQLGFAAQTDVGRLRDHNEDNFARCGDDVFIVADGMGGHASGEIASTVAVDVVCDALRKRRDDGAALEDALRAAIDEANRAVFQASSGSANLKGMGTTLVVAALDGGAAIIAHVGDSRAYRLRAGELERLTKDHSLLQDFIDASGGQMSEEEQRMFPHRNVITRAIGMRETVEPTITRVELAAGDRLLLCSDGLHGAVDEETLRDLMSDVEDLEALVRSLIDLANVNGGTDNITAVVAEVK